MKLVPFSPQYLRLGEPLPFGLRDATGRLLLAAGQPLSEKAMLAEMAAQPLFCDETEAADWHRRLAAAMDAALRQNATLKAVAAARPEDLPPDEPRTARPSTLAEQWLGLLLPLDTLLRELADGRAAAGWPQRVDAVYHRARELVERRPDASLYHLVYEAGHSAQKYSAQHALLVLAMAESTARMLELPPELVRSLGRAALLMNVAMTRLQDQLAQTTIAISAERREEIDRHAEEGARLLANAGLGDGLAIAVVRLHHEAGSAGESWRSLAPERQLARLLRRLDIFAAKISRRASRAPMSPVQAAREACLVAGGLPDEIGGALLKAMGLYPPGSFVELASGELGIVVARGRRANLPFVAALVSAGGQPLGEPVLRDTLDRRFSVKAAVAAARVKVRPPHERLMALR